MSIDNLPDSQRAYRNDLRGEINAIANCNLTSFQGVEGLSLHPSNLLVRPPNYNEDPYQRCFIPREVFDDLVQHEKRFGRVSRMATEDRAVSGVDLLRDNSWPFCRDCLLPFVTLLNGHHRTGYWVSRIEDGAELCESCWLTEHFAGDHVQMIEHVLRCDIGDDSRLIRVYLRRGFDAEAIIFQTTEGYWRSPGLFELLRLHRVSLTECAGVILRMIKALIAEVKADDRSDYFRCARVSKTLTSGTRTACYA